MVLFLPSCFVSISLPLTQDLLFFFLSYFFELIEVFKFPLHPISFPLQILKFHPLFLSCVVILEIWTFTFNLGWFKCNQYLLLPKHRYKSYVRNNIHQPFQFSPLYFQVSLEGILGASDCFRPIDNEQKRSMSLQGLDSERLTYLIHPSLQLGSHFCSLFTSLWTTQLWTLCRLTMGPKLLWILACGLRNTQVFFFTQSQGRTRWLSASFSQGVEAVLWLVSSFRVLALGRPVCVRAQALFTCPGACWVCGHWTQALATRTGKYCHGKYHL